MSREPIVVVNKSEYNKFRKWCKGPENKRRADLVVKDLDKKLSEDEQIELDKLNNELCKLIANAWPMEKNK